MKEGCGKKKKDFIIEKNKVRKIYGSKPMFTFILTIMCRCCDSATMK